LAGAALFMGATAVVAGIIACVPATRLDPVTALRCE